MSKAPISVTQIAQLVYAIRGQRVMLDFDLAELYGIETRALKQAVRRNRDRFPNDFMFEISASEAAALVSQTVIPSVSKFGGAKPMALTEQGVASVLRSERAVKVNIAIMRAFVTLRAALEKNQALAQKFSELEKRVDGHDGEIAAIIDAIRQLMAPPKKSAREIGFHVRESSPRYGTRKRG